MGSQNEKQIEFEHIEAESFCFWADEQATARLSFGNMGQAGYADRAWWQGAFREVGPQRPLSVRFGTPLSRRAVAIAGGLTAPSATPTF